MTTQATSLATAQMGVSNAAALAAPAAQAEISSASLQPASQASPQALSAGSISAMVSSAAAAVSTSSGGSLSLGGTPKPGSSNHATQEGTSAILARYPNPPIPGTASILHMDGTIQIDIYLTPDAVMELVNGSALLFETDQQLAQDIPYLIELKEKINQGNKPTKGDAARLKEIKKRISFLFRVKPLQEWNSMWSTSLDRLFFKQVQARELLDKLYSQAGSLETLEAHAIDAPVPSSAAADDDLIPPNPQADPDTTVSAILAFLEIEPHLEEDERVLTLLIERANKGVKPSKEDLALLGEIEKRKNRFITFDPKVNPKVDGSHFEIARLRPKIIVIERLYNQLNSLLVPSSVDRDGKADNKGDSKAAVKLEGKADTKKESAILKLECDEGSFNPYAQNSTMSGAEMPQGCLFPWRFASNATPASNAWEDHGLKVLGQVGERTEMSHCYSRIVQFANGKRYKLFYTETYGCEPRTNPFLTFAGAPAPVVGPAVQVIGGSWLGTANIGGAESIFGAWGIGPTNQGAHDYSIIPGKARFDLVDENDMTRKDACVVM